MYVIIQDVTFHRYYIIELYFENDSDIIVKSVPFQFSGLLNLESLYTVTFVALS